MRTLSLAPGWLSRRAAPLVRCLAASSIVAAAACNSPTAPKVPTSRATVTPTLAPAAVAEQWRSHVPKAGAESPWSYPAPKLSLLPNRVAVYVLSRPTGPVSLALTLRHGASDVTPEQCGLASLAAQMMAEATKSKDHHALSEAAESLGSTLVGDANRDSLRLTLDTLPEDVESGIGLLAEALLTPAFDPKDFLRLQKQDLDDLTAERQSPGRLASIVGLRAVLGEQLGCPVGGRLTTVKRLTVNDVRRWYQRYAYPDAVALFVVGPVDPDAVVAHAQRILSKMPGRNPKLAAPSPPPAPAVTELYLVDRPSSVQTAVFVAQAYPKRAEPGYAARQVLDNVIGGQFSSRINHNLREEHAYTYGAHSSAIATRHFGLMTISTNVETDVTAAAIQEITKELQELRGPKAPRPIGNDELLRARTGIVQSLGAHLEDSHRLLLDQEALFVHGLDPNYLSGYLSEVRALDAQAIAEQTERLLPNQLTIVVVGDAARLRTQFASTSLKPVPAPESWID